MGPRDDENVMIKCKIVYNPNDIIFSEAKNLLQSDSSLRRWSGR